MLRRAEMMKPAQAMARPAEESLATTGPPAEAKSVSVDRGDEIVELGQLALDRARRVATLGGAKLLLRPKEFDLLFFLANNPDVVHSRNVLLHRVWGYDFAMGTRTVDVHVRWLRQKIEHDASNPKRLETVRGVGYRLTGEALIET